MKIRREGRRDRVCWRMRRGWWSGRKCWQGESSEMRRICKVIINIVVISHVINNIIVECGWLRGRVVDSIDGREGRESIMRRSARTGRRSDIMKSIYHISNVRAIIITINDIIIVITKYWRGDVEVAGGNVFFDIQWILGSEPKYW